MDNPTEFWNLTELWVRCVGCGWSGPVRTLDADISEDTLVRRCPNCLRDSEEGTLVPLGLESVYEVYKHRSTVLGRVVVPNVSGRGGQLAVVWGDDLGDVGLAVHTEEHPYIPAKYPLDVRKVPGWDLHLKFPDPLPPHGHSSFDLRCRMTQFTSELFPSYEDGTIWKFYVRVAAVFFDTLQIWNVYYVDGIWMCKEGYVRDRENCPRVP